jgi:hypothetical protein
MSGDEKYPESGDYLLHGLSYFIDWNSILQYCITTTDANGIISL